MFLKAGLLEPCTLPSDEAMGTICERTSWEPNRRTSPCGDDSGFPISATHATAHWFPNDDLRADGRSRTLMTTDRTTDDEPRPTIRGERAAPAADLTGPDEAARQWPRRASARR
jgi:hypothetical protein